MSNTGGKHIKDRRILKFTVASADSAACWRSSGLGVAGDGPVADAWHLGGHDWAAAASLACCLAYPSHLPLPHQRRPPPPQQHRPVPGRHSDVAVVVVLALVLDGVLRTTVGMCVLGSHLGLYYTQHLTAVAASYAAAEQ